MGDMDRDRPGTTWGMNQYWQCSSATGWWDCCCSLRASPSFHLCVWGDLLRISYVLCAWHQITVVSENLIVTHCRGDAVWSYLRGHIMCHVPEQLVLVGWWVFLRETGYFFKENFTRLPLTTPHPVGYLQENKASWVFLFIMQIRSLLCSMIINWMSGFWCIWSSYSLVSHFLNCEGAL